MIFQAPCLTRFHLAATLVTQEVMQLLHRCCEVMRLLGGGGCIGVNQVDKGLGQLRQVMTAAV